MNYCVVFDWKFVLAVGLAVGFVILCDKVDPSAAEKVLTSGFDACKEYAIANDSDR